MNNFPKSCVKALAVMTVICVPLVGYQLAGGNSLFADWTSSNAASDEPTLAAANPGPQSWTILPNIKNGRFESTAIQYRDDLYTFNGFGLGIKVEHTVEKFDAGTQKWSVISNTSIAQGNAVTHNGFIVNGNEVWMIGGRVGNHPGAVTSKVWKFNLSTHKWTAGPQLPVPVAAGGAALVNNRIHWFGGLDANAQCDVANHYVYDLDNPSAGWSDISGIASMPIPRNHFGTVVHDGLIYAIGGQFTHDGCGAGTPDSDLVHVFNPETNIWTQIASLPAVQSHIEPSTFVHMGAIYVVGGATAGNKVFRYDPSQDNWDTVAELPQPLLAPIAQVVDNELIVSSGGAPATIPSMATYSIDMTSLLLPGATNTNTVDEPDQLIIADTATEVTGEPGLVSLEAEYHDTLTATDTHQWISVTHAGASNNAAMTTTPDNNKLANGSQGSPSMSYFSYFDRPGTWYLWIRGWGDTLNNEGSSDSIHAGLNGTLSPTADKIDNFPSGWNWTSNTRDGVRASLNIPSAGIHAVNLWMREDGLSVDKILLTTDASYQPFGEGPSGDDDAPADNVTSGDTTETIILNIDPEIDTSTDIIIANDETSSDVTTVDSSEDTASNSTGDTTTDSDETTKNDATQDTAIKGSTSDNVATTTDTSGVVNGIVSIEVENYDASTSASNKQWVRSSQSGASGTASMVTTPNTGTLKNSNQDSPELSYQAYFSEAGTYNVWLRGWGDTNGNEGKNDSVHVGINGTLGSAAAIQNFPAGWHWSTTKRTGGSATVYVPFSGKHTINIWMREDGLILDKLILASSPTYTPTNQGPAVTIATVDTSDDSQSSTDVSVTTVVTTPDTTDTTLISLEVENYSSKSANGAHQWLANNKSGASGGSMEATPNTGKLITNTNTSAVMNYSLQFAEAGTYTVWLRGWGDSNSAGKNDSVHIGINSNTAQVLENFPNSWTWSNKKRGGGSVTINIPTVGTHVLKLSMREDGLILDKLILTKDASYIPDNLGPAATPYSQ